VRAAALVSACVLAMVWDGLRRAAEAYLLLVVLWWCLA
jgi:hypothetical protein